MKDKFTSTEFVLCTHVSFSYLFPYSFIIETIHYIFPIRYILMKMMAFESRDKKNTSLLFPSPDRMQNGMLTKQEN